VSEPLAAITAIAKAEAAVSEPATGRAILAAACDLCIDAAAGKVAPADLERWVRAWADQRRAARHRGGFTRE
jgi:hypothetical protein